MLVPRYHYILPLLLIISSSCANLISNKQSNLCSGEEVLSDSSQMTTKLGGLSNQTVSNSAEIDHLARFAVEEHNKKENALLEFTRVVKAQEQVVAGTLHHLTVEAVDAGKKKTFEAKVWVKPWMNFKELQEFKYTGEATADEGRPGLQSVPVHDTAVQDAANHVLKTLQQRSNSLYPYELQEVVQANSEVLEGIAKFDMLVKVKRGGKEEKFKVDVHKDDSGNFHLNKMVQDD